MSEHEPFAIGRGFGHGWKAVQLAIVPMWLGGLLMCCTEGGSGGGGGGGGSSDDDLELPEIDWESFRSGAGDLTALDTGLIVAVLVGLAVVFMIGIAIFCFRSWLHGGYLKLHEETLRTGVGSSSTLFDGGDRFVDMAIFKLLKWVFQAAAAIVSIAPGSVFVGLGLWQEDQMLMGAGAVLMVLIGIPALCYVTLGLCLGEMAVVYDGLGARASVDRSWDLARGRRWAMFWYLLVAGLLQIVAAIVGLLMLCVGLLVTVPLAYSTWAVGFSEAYLLLTRSDEETADWAIWNLAA